uniref:TIR domain-containing protein n=1 Tax=Palpitomonas bilix TaxID=652834 RepID=A0A7S3CZB8_9EUKA|mmetsp:Transcript_15691/g.39888  ORF Transcript_15691/g.39888 Transcript_15691/m.39888 type:complete len:388 (+) Transcript_15691:451-1614(+)
MVLPPLCADINNGFFANARNNISLLDRPNDERDNFGNTPLHYSVKRKNMGLIDMLLNKNANINELNENKETPLFLSCSQGSYDIFEGLLERGADWLQENGDFKSPLMAACESGELRIVKHLVDNYGLPVDGGRDGGSRPIFYAAVQGHNHIVNFLLERGARAIAEEDEMKVGDERVPVMRLIHENLSGEHAQSVITVLTRPPAGAAGAGRGAAERARPEEAADGTFSFEKPYVFLSYRSTERKRVVAIANQLREEFGIQVWLDIERIKPGLGESWMSQIGKGVRMCKAIIGCWSSEWMDSHNCRTEWLNCYNRANSREGMTREDLFAIVVGAWDFQLDDEMSLATWGNAVQFVDVQKAHIGSPEFEENVRKVGEKVAARMEYWENEN